MRNPGEVIDLTPKHKSKHPIEGTAWVDRDSYDIVRLHGSTAARAGELEIHFTDYDIDGVDAKKRTAASERVILDNERVRTAPGAGAGVFFK